MLTSSATSRAEEAHVVQAEGAPEQRRRDREHAERDERAQAQAHDGRARVLPGGPARRHRRLRASLYLPSLLSHRLLGSSSAERAPRLSMQASAHVPSRAGAVAERKFPQKAWSASRLLKQRTRAPPKAR